MNRCRNCENQTNLGGEQIEEEEKSRAGTNPNWRQVHLFLCWIHPPLDQQPNFVEEQFTKFHNPDSSSPIVTFVLKNITCFFGICEPAANFCAGATAVFVREVVAHYLLGSGTSRYFFPHKHHQ